MTLAIGKFVVLLELGLFGGLAHLVIKVEGDVGKLLLDVTDNLMCRR